MDIDYNEFVSVSDQKISEVGGWIKMFISLSFSVELSDEFGLSVPV